MVVNAQRRGFVPRRRPNPARAQTREPRTLRVPVPVSAELPDIIGLKPLDERNLYKYRVPEDATIVEAVLLVGELTGKARVEIVLNGRRLYAMPIEPGEIVLATELPCARHDRIELVFVGEGNEAATARDLSVCMVVGVTRTVN